MLIKHNSSVNALDRWNFTPLHEAAQKGRTQLCALLILHGADVSLHNQEGQVAHDVATVSREGAMGRVGNILSEMGQFSELTRTELEIKTRRCIL